MPRDNKTRQNIAETRSNIVDIARLLFMKYGYRAVSTRQIAKACAITQPALYHHFPDKEAIYTEVMRQEIGKTKRAFDSILERYSELEERLVQLAIYLTLAVPEDIGQMFRDIQNELNPDTRAEIQSLWHDGYLMPIVSTFTDGFSRGILKPASDQVPDAVQSAFLLLRLISRTNPSSLDEKTARREAEMIVGLLLYGLATRSRGG